MYGSDSDFTAEFGSPDREEEKTPRKVIKERKSGVREVFIKIFDYLSSSAPKKDLVPDQAAFDFSET